MKNAKPGSPADVSKLSLKQIIERASALSERYRVSGGGKFFLKRIDPGDTGKLGAADKPLAPDGRGGEGWGAWQMIAMILAAGLGTRMRPLTLLRAKPALPVLNRPLLHWVLDVFRLPIYMGELPSLATFVLATIAAMLVLAIGALTFRATSHRIALYL